jgi:hypothetical protein
MTQARVVPSMRAETVPGSQSGQVPQHQMAWALAWATHADGRTFGAGECDRDPGGISCYLARCVRRCRSCPPQTPAVGPLAAARREEVLAMVAAEMPGTTSTAFSKSTLDEPPSAERDL